MNPKIADHLDYISFDELYHRLHTDKVLINGIDIFVKANKDVLDQMLMKNYTSGSVSIIPSCQCGELKGAYYVGDTCHKCNTKVVNGLDDSVSFLLWLERPQDVECFISPIVIANLRERYKISRPTVRLVDYIMLPDYKVDKKQSRGNPTLEKLDHVLKQHGIQRGYNSFVKNFFKIIEILERDFLKKKAGDPGDFVEFMQSKAEKGIFSNYIPFPNKVLFASETNELGRFLDNAVLSPINAVRRMTGIDLHPRSSAVKQSKVARTLIDLAQFYVSYIDNVVFGKPALIRQQITATRTHFSGRGVITSIPGIHDHDEIYLPWSMACTLLRPFVLKALYAEGMSYRQACNHMAFHNKIFCPIINNVFLKMIEETRATGLPGIKCLFNRNPSLHRGSIQTVRATRIKTDTEDNTISMSDRIGPSFNSDHDGDEMNLYLILTDVVNKAVENLEPYHNVLGLTGPNELSGNIKFPKTLIVTMSNFFNET